jgi:LacI family transcriptional regulator
MATILDIARETGMAKSSVAQILQGRPGYSPASRQRILHTARRLGYHPNYLSKALNGGKSMSIGAIWPMRGITGDVEIAMALLEKARAKGYATYQAEYQSNLPHLRQSLKEFAARRVDALLLGSESAVLRQLRDDLKAFPIVVAAAPDPVPEFGGDLVIHDRYRAIEEAVDHLAAIGRRRVAMVVNAIPSQQGKIDHFLKRCSARGLRVDDRSVVELRPLASPSQLVESYQETYETHFRHGVDADALICGADQGAMAAMEYLQRHALRVPEDVAVVGFNNMNVAALWRPALASIDRNQDQVIEVMERMLFSRLESPGLPPRRQNVPMRFIWRESAGSAQGAPERSVVADENAKPKL